jgi:hypothetical protein
MIKSVDDIVCPGARYVMVQPHELLRVGIFHHFILAASFVACFVTVVFSWPDHHDRKRAIFPHPLRCCEIRVANWVVMPGARADRERLQTAATRVREEAPAARVSQGTP